MGHYLKQKKLLLNTCGCYDMTYIPSELYCIFFTAHVVFTDSKLEHYPRKDCQRDITVRAAPIFGVYGLHQKKQLPFLAKILWLFHLHKSHPSKTSYICLFSVKYLLRRVKNFLHLRIFCEISSYERLPTSVYFF